ncbi:NYN domain-containing protein [Geofilum rhodophaeum]|uniref:NYN domain-containing protein n=1 Tax=Geofilum rhodophaeum TaxID=1965019 RepID=UPI000B524CB8|nr:NYN domain-containing protein [Geofilum rhodophaeum]
MKENREMHLAVLIDGDNIPYANIKGMMEEIAKFGIPTFKRIYGDWTKPQLGGWKGVLLENAITPIQQYSYTSGKNATDSAMIIDAMDILYSGKVDGFCVVSSDSDFTRLATRLRESGMLVIGMGEKKTPSPFIVACDKFIYLEILASSDDKDSDKKSKDKEQASVQKVDNRLLNLLKATIQDQADDDGWAFLGEVGQMLNKKRPDFDPRNYGFSRLTPMLKSLKKNFEVDERILDKSNTRHVYVRARTK